MKKWFVIASILLFVIFAAPNSAAQGESFAFQFSMGIQGSLSFFEVGIRTPTLGENVFLGFKARIMSSITWATFIHQNGESVSFHPAVLGGIITCGGNSPFIDDRFRMYGAADLFLGWSFTPYDSLIYKTGNLIGKNITFGIWGYYGAEIFTAENIAYYVDAGGGYKSLKGDKTNMYVIAGSWLGSGFGMKSGMRFYL